MKNFLIAIFSVVILVTGCTKSHKTTVTYMNTGIITGPDLGMTVCSEGYFITVTGVPGIIRLSGVPSGCGIDLTTATFPLNVKLNWHYSSEACGIIAVDAITTY